MYFFYNGYVSCREALLEAAMTTKNGTQVNRQVVVMVMYLDNIQLTFTTSKSILKAIILKIKILKWIFLTHQKTFLYTFQANLYFLHVFSFIHKTGGRQLSSKVIGIEFLFFNYFLFRKINKIYLKLFFIIINA